MSPEQQKYVVQNNFQNNELILLRRVNFLILFINVVLIALVVFYTQIFLFAIVLLFFPIYDLFFSSQTLFIVDEDQIIEVTSFKVFKFEKSSYSCSKYLLKNKVSKRNYLIITDKIKIRNAFKGE